jgi:hypothetical protein
VQALEELAHAWLDSLQTMLTAVVHDVDALQLGASLALLDAGLPGPDNWAIPREPAAGWKPAKPLTHSTVLKSFADVGTERAFDLAAACISYQHLVAAALTEVAVTQGWLFPEASSARVLHWAGVKGGHFDAAAKEAGDDAPPFLDPALKTSMQAVARAEVRFACPGITCPPLSKCSISPATCTCLAQSQTLTHCCAGEQVSGGRAATTCSC